MHRRPLRLATVSFAVATAAMLSVPTVAYADIVSPDSGPSNRPTPPPSPDGETKEVAPAPDAKAAPAEDAKAEDAKADDKKTDDKKTDDKKTDDKKTDDKKTDDKKGGCSVSADRSLAGSGIAFGIALLAGLALRRRRG